jgi:hypothetical protein
MMTIEEKCMRDTNTGGPAFARPASPAHEYGFHKHQEGMTLRDYFAAKAMQARLTRPADPLPAPQWFGPGHEVEDARACYALADAMLKARES